MTTTKQVSQKRSQFFIGLDLGQARDYTAIVIVERVRRQRSETPNESLDEYYVRYTERLPLGTSYPDIIQYVKGLLNRFFNFNKDEGRRVTLIVDATGVGRPVIDSLKADGLTPVPVTVTGGLNVVHDDTGWRVPKRDLVSAVKILLGKRQLKIAKGMPLADVLVRELENFRVKVNTATGHDSYEAWSENEHDDLVFALSIACWWALQKQNFFTDIDPRDVVSDTAEGAVRPEDDYRIGWVPSRNAEYGVLAVYNIRRHAVVHLQRSKYESIEQHIDKVFQEARRYHAVVRAQAGTNEAILKTLERRGAYVRRIDMSQPKLSIALENLSLLISYEELKLPDDPDLLAELEIGDPYESGALMALCLVTHDVHPLELDEDDDLYYRVETPADTWDDDECWGIEDF